MYVYSHEKTLSTVAAIEHHLLTVLRSRDSFSKNDIEEWKFCLVRLNQVSQKAHCPSIPFKQAKRSVGHASSTLKLLCEQKLGKLLGTVEVFVVSSQSIQKKEDIAIPRHPMADARAFF